MSGRHSEPERSITNRQFIELPQRPDSRTGDPAPPSAPNYQGTETPAGENRSLDRRLFRKPPAPPGMGPVESWRHDSVKTQVRNYIGILFFLIIGVGVISLIRGDGLDMLLAWPLYPILLIGAYLMSSPLDVRTDSVGVDWLQSHYRKRWYQRRRKVVWLKLYELTRVEGVPGPGPAQLYLQDSDGATMVRFLWDLQPDRLTWDLVYNGILHSVANGASTDAISEGVLKLAETPALRLRDAGPSQHD